MEPPEHVQATHQGKAFSMRRRSGGYPLVMRGASGRIAVGFPIEVFLICALAVAFPVGATAGAVLERQYGVSPYTECAFSPDGMLFLTAHMDATLRLWDMDTGAELWSIPTESVNIQSVAFSHDATRIFLIGSNAQILTLDSSTGEILDVFATGLQESWRGGYLSPRGRFAVLSSRGNAPRVWDLSLQMPIFAIGDQSSWAVHAARFSSDARRMIAITNVDGARLWDMEGRAPLFQMEVQSGWTPSLCDISPDGSRAGLMTTHRNPVTRIQTRQLHVLDIDSRTIHTVSRLSLRGTPSLMRFLPDARHILFVYDQSVAFGWTLLDAETGRAVRDVQRGMRAFPTSLEISPQGIAPMLYNTTGLCLYKVLEDADVHVLGDHFSIAGQFAVARNGAAVAYAPYYGSIPRVWSTNDMRNARLLFDLGIQNHPGVQLTADATYCMLSSQPPMIFRLDAASHPQGQLFSADNGAFVGIILASDASFAAFSRPDGTVDIWRRDAVAPIHVLRDYGQPKSALALSADDRLLATGDYSGVVSIWDTHTGEHKQQFRDLTSRVLSVAISPDGSRVAAGVNHEGRFLLWDGHSGRVLATHRQRPNAIAFDYSGERIAVPGPSGINILDARSGQPMRRIGSWRYPDRVHTYGIGFLQFSLDGSRLYSASQFDGVKQWLLNTGSQADAEDNAQEASEGDSVEGESWPGDGLGIDGEAGDGADGESNTDGEFSSEGDGVGNGGWEHWHDADSDRDGRIDLRELIRVVQIYNAGGYQCAPLEYATEDGFVPGLGDFRDCRPHSGDFNPQNWTFELGELLRMLEIYSHADGYVPCAFSEDGVCLAGASTT